MRKTFVILGAMLMVGAVLPTATAHWDWVKNGVDCNNAQWDETDLFEPGLATKNLQEDTCGVAGRVVGFAGPSIVGTDGAVAGAAGLALCDIEVGDVTGGVGGSASANLNEVEIDEHKQPGSVPDNTWDDGGYGAACHVDSYSVNKWNTIGCGETADHGFARANPATPLPVFVSTGCDMGSVSTNSDPVNAVLGASSCSVNQVFEGTPGEIPGCLQAITQPAPSGYTSCRTDGSSDDGNFGYADESSGPAVPTNAETQATVGGGLDCSDTTRSTVVFVFKSVDLATPTVSGPATHVWTTGQR